MSVYGGPDIETDGLALHFDAGNVKSRSELYTKPNTNILAEYNLWTVGTGGSSGYSLNGATSENSRVLINDDPWGKTSVVWKTSPDSGSGPDGGWNTSYYGVDNTKTHRMSVWVRKASTSNGGNFYFGLNPGGYNPIRNDNNNAQSNPYFSYVGINNLTYNQWYLVVGHVFYAGYSAGTRHPDSGWYENGVKISDKSYGNCGTKDLRIDSRSTSLRHRTYHFYCTNTSASLEFAAPRIDVCDGDEPSIDDLLRVGPQEATGLSQYSRRPKFKNNTAFSFEKRGALTLDGTSDYLDLETDVTISPTNQGWTAVYWFNTSSASTLQHFNSAEADDFNANWLSINSSKLAVWNVSPGYWRYGSTTLQSNTWYQAVFVCDSGGTNYRFYINGQREGGDHVNNTWSSTYSALKTRYIGRYEYNGTYSRYFAGKIASARMYSRALSDAEILKGFNSLKGRFGL